MDEDGDWVDGDGDFGDEDANMDGDGDFDADGDFGDENGPGIDEGGAPVGQIDGTDEDGDDDDTWVYIPRPTQSPGHHHFDLATDSPTSLAQGNDVQSALNTSSKDIATKGSHMYTAFSVLIAGVGAYFLYQQYMKKQNKGQPKSAENLRGFHDEFEDQLDAQNQGGGFKDVELDSDSEEEDDDCFIIDAETLHRMN